MICELCERKEVPELTEHHLVPKSRGGRDVVSLCRDCHRQIHVLFDNKSLEREFNTIASLKNNEKVSLYIRWVRKRPFGVVHKAKRSNESKRRGRGG